MWYGSMAGYHLEIGHEEVDFDLRNQLSNQVTAFEDQLITSGWGRFLLFYFYALTYSRQTGYEGANRHQGMPNRCGCFKCPFAVTTFFINSPPLGRWHTSYSCFCIFIPCAKACPTICAPTPPWTLFAWCENLAAYFASRMVHLTRQLG